MPGIRRDLCRTCLMPSILPINRRSWANHRESNLEGCSGWQQQGNTQSDTAPIACVVAGKVRAGREVRDVAEQMSSNGRIAMVWTLAVIRG